MRKITGSVALSSIDNIISKIKSYKGKKERNDLIASWRKLYATEKNKKHHFIIVKPDLPEINIIERGEVALYDENMQFFESSQYNSISDREKLVKCWIKKHELQKYFLEIIPQI
jgi:hypothetical protein